MPEPRPMRRRLLTATALTLLLTTVPAGAALAGERTGEPAEEPDHNGSGEETAEPDPARDRQPADDDQPDPDDDTATEDAADAPTDGNDTAGPVECAEPEVSRSYTAEAMVMTAELDLRGCDWWDGSMLELVGVIARDDGSGETDGNLAFQAVTCSDKARLRNDPEPQMRVVGCAIEVVLPHPPTEVAYYWGGISWIWEDGLHRIDLDTSSPCRSNRSSASNSRRRPRTSTHRRKPPGARPG